MRILVTGASGRVGSRLVPRLLGRYEGVRVLVRNEEQAEKFEGAGAETTVGDLLRPETLIDAVAGVEAVVHLAAFFRGATDVEARAANLDGTLALARAARAAHVKRFIYISTNVVYGPGVGRPLREDDEPRPSPDRAYPVSKLAAERGLAELYRDDEASLTILRLAFVYGEGDPHLSETLRLMRTWPPTKRLQMVHHADVAQAVMLTLDKQQAAGQVFNVADDVPVPIAEVWRRNGLTAPQGEQAADVADPWEGIVDTSKIKRELGFCPLFPSLDEAERGGAL